MAESRVNFIIDATDKTGGAFSSFNRQVNGLQEAAVGAFRRVGEMALNAAVQIGQVMVDEVGKSITAASDLNETISKTGVVFGDAADQILAFSESSVAIGQSQQAALDAAATFGIFGKSAGLTGEALGTFSTDLVTLASDIASFNNANPEEVVTALGAALRGEAEPMRRFGVLLDDATMRNKALEMGIISSISEALTPQQKILAANALIFEQTADAQGDFARTSEGLANQQRILNAAMENIRTELGAAFLPVVNQVAGAMSAWLTDPATQAAIQQLIAWLGTNLPIAIQTVSDFWTTSLYPALVTIWDFVNKNIVPILIKVWEWISVNLPPAIQALSDFWTKTLYPALEKIYNFLFVTMMPVWEALGELIGVIVVKSIETLTGIWENVLKPALQAIWDFMQKNIIPIFETWGEKLGGVKGIIDLVVGGIQDMTTWLQNIELPDWMTPGSPTPWETGLVGVADAMSALTNVQLPQFSAQLSSVGAIGAQGSTITNNWNVSLATNAPVSTIGRDLQMLSARAV